MSVFPTYLVDDYPDGAINEKAWVQVTEITANPRDAIDWLAKEIEPDDEMRYIVIGTSHQRPSGYPIKGKDGRSVKELDEYPPCDAEGCKEGRVELIDEIRQPPDKESALARFIGYELTDNRTAQIEELGGKVVATTREDCEECLGTGRKGEFIYDSCEPIPWEACEDNHPEALHFWNIELTDDPEAPMFPAGVPDVSEHQERMDIG